MTDRKPRGKRDPLPRCPHPKHINAIQFQLFDNGSKPGRGKSQHVMKVEVYCEGRLVLEKPTWARAIPLIDPKKFMAWADREHAAGRIDQANFEGYQSLHEMASSAIEEGGFEFVKLGHVGSPDNGTTYIVGQYIIAMKRERGGLDVILQIDGEAFHTDSFFYNRGWRPGGRARKFQGMYDPHDMYGEAKREQGVIDSVIARRRAMEAGE